MRLLSTARSRPLISLACVAVLGLATAGCGKLTHQQAGEENDGVYVNAGRITYQLQVSRELNQYATEDRQYITGLSASETSLSPTQEWYGVFLWAKNQSGAAQTTGLKGAITTQGFLTISANHTFDADAAGNYAVTASSGWTNSGTYTARQSSVTFTGGSLRTVTPGGSPFYDLLFNGAGATWNLAFGLSGGLIIDAMCPLVDSANRTSPPSSWVLR